VTCLGMEFYFILASGQLSLPGRTIHISDFPSLGYCERRCLQVSISKDDLNAIINTVQIRAYIASVDGACISNVDSRDYKYRLTADKVRENHFTKEQY